VNDLDADELLCAHGLGEHGGLINGMRIPLGQRLSGWVAANRQTIRNSDPVLDLGEAARSMTPRPKSCLSTPVVVGDSVVAVLSVYSSTLAAFSEEHQRLIEVVARQVGSVVHQATKVDVTTVAIPSDQLMTLPSLEQLHLFAPLHGTGISLIYIDVNEHMEINATHGRQMLSEALSHVVACVRRHIRADDVVFSHGSGQFVIVQFGADKVLSAAVAARIRQHVESQPIGTSVRLRVRVTVGVAAMPDDGQAIDALIAAARQRIGRARDEFGRSPGPVH
jgi:diguanylate cyclase (GGDEF)-like protein